MTTTREGCVGDVIVDSETGDVKLVLDFCGDGRRSDYDPTDPNDCPRLRCEIYVQYDPLKAYPAGQYHFLDEDSEAGDWPALRGSCTKTCLDAREPEDRVYEAARGLLEAVLAEVQANTFDSKKFKRLAKQMCSVSSK